LVSVYKCGVVWKRRIEWTTSSMFLRLSGIASCRRSPPSAVM